MRQRLRAWSETLETFFREVIVEERRGTREALVRALLYACSKGFHAAVKTRRFLYARGAGHRRRQPDGRRHRKNSSG